jgi:hypothetical protein
MIYFGLLVGIATGLAICIWEEWYSVYNKKKERNKGVVVGCSNKRINNLGTVSQQPTLLTGLLKSTDNGVVVVYKICNNTYTLSK